MEVCVQLKVCEGCGSLWLRAQELKTVYCKTCEHKLREFPSPESRKRRGRPCRKQISRLYAVATECGGRR